MVRIYEDGDGVLRHMCCARPCEDGHADWCARNYRVPLARPSKHDPAKGARRRS